MSCRRVGKSAAVAWALACATACHPRTLPGTDIVENDDTRAIYDLMVAYRNALQARDPERVLALVSKDYFETSGTEDPADDYGYEGLREHLKADFARTLALRVDIRLQEISVSGDTALVTYRYLSRAHVRFPSGDKWIATSDVNRLRLKREPTGWKIVSGL